MNRHRLITALAGHDPIASDDSDHRVIRIVKCACGWEWSPGEHWLDHLAAVVLAVEGGSKPPSPRD